KGEPQMDADGRGWELQRHLPATDFTDDTDLELQRQLRVAQIRKGAKIPTAKGNRRWTRMDADGNCNGTCQPQISRMTQIWNSNGNCGSRKYAKAQRSQLQRGTADGRGWTRMGIATAPASHR